MSTDANKAIVERFFDGVLTRNDQTVATQLVDPACVFHHPMLPNGSGNALDVANLMAMFRSAFPDLSYQIEDLIAEHDKVAARWTARGTHLGDFSGVKSNRASSSRRRHGHLSHRWRSHRRNVGEFGFAWADATDWRGRIGRIAVSRPQPWPEPGRTTAVAVVRDGAATVQGVTLVPRMKSRSPTFAS